MSRFRATEISPFNQYAIPDHAYVEMEIEQGSEFNQPQSPKSADFPQSASRSTPQPGCSHYPDSPIADQNISDDTPGKLINKISSFPRTSAVVMVKNVEGCWQQF